MSSQNTTYQCRDRLREIAEASVLELFESQLQQRCEAAVEEYAAGIEDQICQECREGRLQRLCEDAIERFEDEVEQRLRESLERDLDSLIEEEVECLVEAGHEECVVD